MCSAEMPTTKILAKNISSPTFVDTEMMNYQIDNNGPVIALKGCCSLPSRNDAKGHRDKCQNWENYTGSKDTSGSFWYHFSDTRSMTIVIYE